MLKQPRGATRFAALRRMAAHEGGGAVGEDAVGNDHVAPQAVLEVKAAEFDADDQRHALGPRGDEGLRHAKSVEGAVTAHKAHVRAGHGCGQPEPADQFEVHPWIREAGARAGDEVRHLTHVDSGISQGAGGGGDRERPRLGGVAVHPYLRGRAVGLGERGGRKERLRIGLRAGIIEEHGAAGADPRLPVDGRYDAVVASLPLREARGEFRRVALGDPPFGRGRADAEDRKAHRCPPSDPAPMTAGTNRRAAHGATRAACTAAITTPGLRKASATLRQRA